MSRAKEEYPELYERLLVMRDVGGDSDKEFANWTIGYLEGRISGFDFACRTTALAHVRTPNESLGQVREPK